MILIASYQTNSLAQTGFFHLLLCVHNPIGLSISRNCSLLGPSSRKYGDIFGGIWRAKAELQARRQMSKLQEQTAHLSSNSMNFRIRCWCRSRRKTIGKEIGRRFLPGGDLRAASKKVIKINVRMDSQQKQGENSLC